MLTKLEYQQIVVALEGAKHVGNLDNGVTDDVVPLDYAIKLMAVYTEENNSSVELHRTDR